MKRMRLGLIKIIVMLTITAMLAVGVSACGGAATDGAGSDAATDSGTATDSDTATGGDSGESESEKREAAIQDLVGRTEGIDVDLTLLSSTMVYAEVSNMMANPDNYLGKIVKMSGKFATYKDEASGKMYYACLIQDALACCAQGIEFVRRGDYSFPEDYPELDEVISVVGVFDTYEEEGLKYLTLRDAELIEG